MVSWVVPEREGRGTMIGARNGHEVGVRAGERTETRGGIGIGTGRKSGSTETETGTEKGGVQGPAPLTPGVDARNVSVIGAGKGADPAPLNDAIGTGNGRGEGQAHHPSGGTRGEEEGGGLRGVQRRGYLTRQHRALSTSRYVA